MRRWIGRAFVSLAVVVAIACFAIWVVEFYPRHGSHPPLRLAKGTVAIQHARIYSAPGAPPIEDGTILIRDGLIVQVGANLPIPADAVTIPCDHCIVTAGFWNAHVHFTEPKWNFAQWKSDLTLDPQLADMFLSRGFTTVIDLGSTMPAKAKSGLEARRFADTALIAPGARAERDSTRARKVTSSWLSWPSSPSSPSSLS